jgi:hypothetical protein
MRGGIHNTGLFGLKALILSAILYMAALPAAAQEGTIALPVGKLTGREVFDNILRQTKYQIATNTVRQATLAVTVDSSPVAVRTVLERLFAGSDMGYRMEGDYIIITEKPAPAPVPPAPDAYYYTPPPEPEPAPRPTPVAPAPAPTPVSVSVSVPVPAVPEPAPTVVVELPRYELSSNYTPVSSYAANEVTLPRVALKTNLLYGAGTLTPNLGLEVGTGLRTSVQLTGSYHPWGLKGTLESNKKLVHMFVKPEFRWWLCERFNGHFFGADLIFARYNIGTYDIPMLFEKEYRYNGIAYGGGVTWGYNRMLGKRWGLEFAVGGGVLWIDYDRFDCILCASESKPGKKIYLGPTNLAINLVFLIK